MYNFVHKIGLLLCFCLYETNWSASRVQLCIETLCKRATSVAHLTNFFFEFFYKIFTEDASRPLLYHGGKKSKMTKNSNQWGGGGSCLNCFNGHIQRRGHTTAKLRVQHNVTCSRVCSVTCAGCYFWLSCCSCEVGAISTAPSAVGCIDVSVAFERRSMHWCKYAISQSL